MELQWELRCPQACECLRVSLHHSHCGNHTLCWRIKLRAAPHGHLGTMWDVLGSAAPALPPEPYPSAAAPRGQEKIH